MGVQHPLQSETPILAERALIGVLLARPDLFHEVGSIVSENDFLEDACRTFYSAMKNLSGQGKPVDIVTVGEAVDDIAGASMLARDVFQFSNVKSYAEFVREHSRKRAIADVAHAHLKKLQESCSAAVVASLSARLEELSVAETGSDKNFNDVIVAGLDAIDEVANSRGGLVGIPTGLAAIDARTGGLQDSRLIILAARPSIGKTAFVNQIGLHAASQGHAVGTISLEMSFGEIAIRSLANRYKLNGTALQFGYDSEVKKLADKMAVNNISGLPIWMDESTFSLDGIISRICEWHRKHGIKLAVVDHAGLVEVAGAASPVERLSRVSRALKKLAKRLHIPIVLVSQLNRNVEKEKRFPFLSDLRDSGSLEQDCDVAIFLHATAEDEIRKKIPIKIGLLKNRTGKKGWLSETFLFDGRTQSFIQV